MHKTRFAGDPEKFTFGVMQFFYTTQPQGPTGSSKASKRGPFPGSLNKSWEFGGLVYKRT